MAAGYHPVPGMDAATAQMLMLDDGMLSAPPPDMLTNGMPPPPPPRKIARVALSHTSPMHLAVPSQPPLYRAPAHPTAPVGAPAAAAVASSGAINGPPPSRVIQLTNCRILRGRKLVQEDLWILDGRFVDAQSLFYGHRRRANVKINCDGLIVSPGLIDLRVHGAYGVDFTSVAADHLASSAAFVARNLVRHGVTAILPSLAPMSPTGYRQAIPALSAARRAMGSRRQAADILGIHLDGPFVGTGEGSPSLDNGLVSLFGAYGGSLDDVRMLSLSPELPGAMAIIPELTARGIVVAATHSSVSIDDAERAVQLGVSLIERPFQSTVLLNQHDPGLLGLLGSDHARPYYTVNADGVTLHRYLVKMAHRLHPTGAVLTSDCTAAMGLEPLNGSHSFGAVPLDQCLRNYRAFTGCSLGEALATCTLHPAELLGIANRKGTLAVGADADFILLDDDLVVKATYMRGEMVWVTESAAEAAANNAHKPPPPPS